MSARGDAIIDALRGIGRTLHEQAALISELSAETQYEKGYRDGGLAVIEGVAEAVESAVAVLTTPPPKEPPT